MRRRTRSRRRAAISSEGSDCGGDGRGREKHACGAGSVLVSLIVTDVERPFRGDMDLFQCTHDPVWSRLAGRVHDDAEEVEEAHLLEAVAEAVVPVGDDCKLQPKGSQPLERLDDAGEDLEPERTCVDGSEFADVEARVDGVEEDGC